MKKEQMSSPYGIEFLAATELFRGLGEVVLQNLAAELVPLQISAGHTLIRQGDAGDCMYVVVSGRLQVSLAQIGKAPQVIREMGIGESIGEIALLTGQTRTATVSAIEATEVARLSKESFERLAAASPEMASQLQHSVTEYLRRRQLRAALKATRLLNDLDEALLSDLEAQLTWVSLVSGETLVRQGDLDDCMYVIVSGRLRVVQQRTGEAQHILRELGRGESMGEIALLTGERRTATVYAIRDTEVAKLSKTSFDHLLGQHPHTMVKTFMRSLIEIISSHEAKPTRADRKISLTVAIIPAHDGLLLTEFTQRLVQALSILGPTLHLSSERVDAYLGKPGTAQEQPNRWDATDVRLVSWLSEQEFEHRYVVYEADPALTAWTQRCVRQADHILIVGYATHDPTPGALEMALFASEEASLHKQTSLVLLHRDGKHWPSGVQHWLAARHLDQHHHIRWNQRSDFERLARIIAGRAIGIVLGGGGARGGAHLGVLRALEEANIPLDFIGGVSAGAVIAALYAMGYELATIVQLFKGLVSRNQIDFTLPIVALTSGNLQLEYFRELFGKLQVEDLWLPCFCVSTNLTRAEVVIHRKGSLRHAISASNAAPGICPPVVDQGELLVDGGLLNNLPMDIMRKLCGDGTVIAVDVMPPVDLAAIASYGDVLSGWQALWDRVNPQSAQSRMPHIAALLYRAGEVGSIHALKTQLVTNLADLYLHPPIEKFGMMEWSALNQIIELGYQDAKAQIARWQEESKYGAGIDISQGA